jgi:nicotinamidase-related amidase
MTNLSALLVIDVQNGLFAMCVPVYQADNLIKNLNALIRLAHEKDVPVFFVQHANQFLVKGEESWRIHPRLEVGKSDRVIQKAAASAFHMTSLEGDLRTKGTKSLVVAGLATQGGVQKTCLDSLKLGFKTILASDGHSTYHKHASRLIENWNQKLCGRGVELKTAEEIDFT